VAEKPYGHLGLSTSGTFTMNKTNRIRRFLLRSAAMFAALMAPSLGYAQSCALCYSQAAGSGARLIQALRSGILVLVFPPMLICIGIAVMAYRKRNQFNEE
jgi:hypothetical protein